MISGAFFHIIWQVNRRAMVTATDEFGLTVGARVWRSLVRRLQEMDSLFGIIASQIRAPQRVRSWNRMWSLFSFILFLVDIIWGPVNFLEQKSLSPWMQISVKALLREWGTLSIYYVICICANSGCYYTVIRLWPCLFNYMEWQSVAYA